MVQGWSRSSVSALLELLEEHLAVCCARGRNTWSTRGIALWLLALLCSRINRGLFEHLQQSGSVLGGRWSDSRASKLRRLPLLMGAIGRTFQ